MRGLHARFDRGLGLLRRRDAHRADALTPIVRTSDGLGGIAAAVPLPPMIGPARIVVVQRRSSRATSATRTDGSVSARPLAVARSGRRCHAAAEGARRLGRALAFRLSTGSRTISDTGASSSASRLMNEVLAPFSSRRRTR